MKLQLLNYDYNDFATTGDMEKIAEINNFVSNDAKNSVIKLNEIHPNTDYAVILHEDGKYMPKYACYNKELTEYNMAILASTINEIPDEVIKTAAANLTCAGQKYNLPIPEELTPYMSYTFIDRHVDLNNINFPAFMDKTANCKKSKKTSKKMALKNKYPIDTPNEIQKAASWFDRNHSKLTVDDILEFTSNITTAAKEQNVSLEKTAVANYVNLDTKTFNPDLFTNISIRKNYISDDNSIMKDTYDEVLRRADEIGPIKTAQLIELLDEQNNLTPLYNKTILDPLTTTLAITKTAGMEIDGKIISKKQLHNILSTKNVDILDPALLKDLKGPEGLEILYSLPSPLRNEIMRHV